MHARKFGFLALAASVSFLPDLSLKAANLKSAEITAIVNDVKVVNSGQGSRPAKLQETISGQSSVQTGLKSRTELLFSDNTMARLGANSMFSFTNGTRDIDLKQGTMLLQVPKGAGGAKITTAAVTAAITGTTIMIEYFPGGFTKVIVLEGTLRLFLNNRVGESTLLEAGKMVILNPNSTQLPEPVDVDIKRLVKTSKLITAIEGTDMDLKIVDAEIAKQEKEKKKGDLIGTNLVINGSGTEVIIASEELLNTLQNASFEQTQLLGENSNGSPDNGGNNNTPPGPNPPGPTPPTPPVPTKYNPLPTITNPNPYVINSTTTVVTDPTITTNGVTDQGTLYNSTHQTGPSSTFLFGSTSSFDTASGFDTAFLGQDYGVFRFSDLEISGNPTFNTVGGPKNVFLVSETNISSTSGSYALDFSSLDFLGLATVDGQITLGNSITSITGPTGSLDLHARGANGVIFLDTDVTTPSGKINLYAESDIRLGSVLTASQIKVRSFGDIIRETGGFVLDAPDITLNASGTISLDPSSIDKTGLTNFSVTAGGITISGTQNYSGATAVFNAGTSGISNNGSASLLNITSINTTGSISLTGTNSYQISASGLVAASGDINVSGDVSAGGVNAGGNIDTHKLASTGSINSAGNIYSQGDMTATHNITATGTVYSAADIVAGDLLQGAGITAYGNISGGTVESLSSGINSYGGAITSTTAKIKSAGNIDAQGGSIVSANNIEAVGDITANGDISAIGIITGANILANGPTGGIYSGGNITATGDLGSLYANTTTFANGSITANRLLGGNDPGAASGATTFQAGTITAGDVVIRNGDNPIILDAHTVVITAQTTDISSTTFTSNLQNLTLNGANAVNLNLLGNLGLAATPLVTLTTDANVTIVGSNSIYATHLTSAGNVTLSGANGNLYTALGSVGGNLTVNQIKQTSSASHSLTVTGVIEASGTFGLDFQGSNGSNGGNLTLTGNAINFNTGTGAINGATFVGGDSASSANGGAGGLLYVISSTLLDVNPNGSIYAHGGSSTGGNGGAGGGVNMEVTGTGSILSSSGGIDAKGADGALNGGLGGSIVLTANSNTGKVNQNAGILDVSGGNAASGSGGFGGIVELHAEGSNGQVNTVTTASIFSNGGNSSAGPGGAGGYILMKANGVGGSINHASANTFPTITANGGSSTGFKGGSGGNLELQGGNITTGASTVMEAIGGDALSGSAEGGDGGTFTATSTTGSAIDLQGTIRLSTGTNSGVVYGGNGGTATITGGGPVTISGTIKTSEDTVTGKISKNGGKIAVSSAETDALKPGITIANSGQLLALLNASSVGKGGKIEFTSAGGIISVAGTVDAGKKGQAGTSGTDGVLKIVNNGANGKVNILSTANLRGDVVKAGAFGNNGMLTINGGGTGGLNADSQIKLYGNSANGTVLFTGGTVNITSPSVIISANTVQVDNGTNVNTGAVAAQVYANNRVWNATQGGNGVATGTWSTNPVNAGVPTAAPAF